MQKRAHAFFLLLMSVFMLGIFIHLIVPLQIIVNATQRAEEVYNGYKIQVEQNTVRAIAYLNSLSISNHIQMYENVRSAVIRLFDTGDRYQDIDVTKIFLNNAYQVANSNGTISDQHSMWFITGINSVSQMTEYEQWIYTMYAQIQKYLDSIEIHNKFHEGLKSIEITIDFEGQHVYFQYPTSAKEHFKNLNASIFTEEFNSTILNFKTQNRYQTTFHQNNILKTCSPILDGTQPFAVVCLALQIQTFTRKVTSALKVPNFQLSSSRYYIVRPIYQYEGLNYPQIISYFNSYDLNNVYVPEKQYFQQDLLDSKQLFSSKQNYLLNIQQLQKTKTYYVTPIETYNNIDSKQIIMYLIVVNDFSISEIKNASHYKQIFVVMIVPSTILLIISALSMGFFIRPLFKKLHQYSSLMNEYCNFIRKNDLTLEVSEVGQTSDFIQIFRKLKYLNLINKLSTPSYLKVSQNERIMKLLRGLQLFDQLAYNKTNIYQNLAKCYYQIGQLQNALKFLKLSVERSVFQLGGIEGIQAMMKEQVNNAKIQKKGLVNKKQKERPSMRHLRYKIFRLCSILYQIHKSGEKYILQELTKNVQILKRLHYGSNLSIEYVFCFIIEIICSFDNYILYEQKQTLRKINLARQMIKKLENSGSKSNKIVPIQIVKSYLYYLKGKWLKRKEQYFQAYENFILSLNGQYFDPTLHLKIKEQIIQIMKILELENHFPQKTFKYLNKKNDRGKQIRQFIFLSDVSNPRMNIQQFNSWKLKARKTAEYIMDNFIKQKDRIGISEFCNELKVVCNLVQKNISQTMLKKELMSSIKARDQTIYSHLIPNLRRAIERTKNLKNQKIFLIFLKEGYEVSSQQIIQQIRNEFNSTFIFLVQQMSERIKDIQQQGFYVVQFERYDDLNIILGEKNIIKADNIIYLF